MVIRQLLIAFFLSSSFSVCFAATFPKPIRCIAGYSACPDGGCAVTPSACKTVPGRKTCGIGLCYSYMNCDDEVGLCLDPVSSRMCRDGSHCAKGYICSGNNHCWQPTDHSRCTLEATAFTDEVKRIGVPSASTSLILLSAYRALARPECLAEKRQDQIDYIDGQYQWLRGLTDAARMYRGQVVELDPAKKGMPLSKGDCHGPRYTTTSWCASSARPAGQQKACVDAPTEFAASSFNLMQQPSCKSQIFMAAVATFDGMGNCRRSVVTLDPKDLDRSVVDSTTEKDVHVPIVLDAIDLSLATQEKHTVKELVECYRTRHDEAPCACN